MRLHGLVAAGLLASAACGISKDDHQMALDQQKEALQAKMAQQQAACEEEIRDRDNVIEGLETKVQAMGGDLERVREELGERAQELASTRTELAATEAEVEQLRALRARAEAEKAQFKALTERFQEMIDAGQLEVVRRDGRMMLKLPDEILFPSGSQRLKKGGREALIEVAKALKEVGADREYLVAGHTDNVPVGRRSRFDNNWELSTARATTVVELMIDQGVPPDQLAAAGFGEYDPIASNETPEGRQKNRRLEIILMPKITPIELE
jgi:chemotaxis protein MotB